MVLAGLAMLKNEGDIVESFVRHNLNFLERLHIILQPSDDGTDEILGALLDEGLPIEVSHNSDAGFPQGKILTAKARELIGNQRAETLFILDSDEFIKTPEPEILRKSVAAVPKGMFACWTWQSYVPTSTNRPSSMPVTDWITHRLQHEHAPVYKVILNSTFMDENFELGMGSHRINSVNGRDEMKDIALLKGSFLAHFPVRTAAQINRKIVNGISVLNVENSKDPYTGYHWRLIHEAVADRDVDLELLQLLAADYQFHGNILQSNQLPPLMSDPVDANYSLRYDHLYRLPALQDSGL